MTDEELKEMEVSEMREWGLPRLREAYQGLGLEMKGRLSRLSKTQLMERLERAIRGAGAGAEAGGSGGGSSRSGAVPMSWGQNA